MCVDVVGGNRVRVVVCPPPSVTVVEKEALLEGKEALQFLHNPRAADCILVLGGSQHIRACSAYPRRWSSFFDGCFRTDTIESKFRCVEVDPPCPDHFLAAIEYLYTGIFPAHDADTLFGLLRNANYLMCERLSMYCIDKLSAALRGDGYKPYSSHPSSSSGLVPAKITIEDRMWERSMQGARACDLTQALCCIDIALDYLNKETEKSVDIQPLADLCTAVIQAGRYKFGTDQFTAIFVGLRGAQAYPEVLQGCASILARKAVENSWYSRQSSGSG